MTTPLGTQHRVRQLEQPIRSRGQAAVELLPEPVQVPERLPPINIMHTDHAALGSNFLLSQEESSAKDCFHDQLGYVSPTGSLNNKLSGQPVITCGEERVRAQPELGRSGLALVVEDLGIRQPTEVIDGVVQEPVAA